MRVWDGVQACVGRTSRRSVFPPPEERTTLWKEVFSSFRSWVFCASVALSKTGSLTLSKSRVRGSSRNVEEIWVQVALKRASTLSWSVGIFDIHCHESW
jgi:hypothetical protein